MQMDEFLKRVRVRAGLSSCEEARRDVEAVLETLKTRISYEAGDNVAAQLPKELKDMWDSSLLERLQRSFGGVEHMDLGAFLARVAQKAGLLDVNAAEMLTSAVFITIREQVTPGAAESIEHQLPPDIRDLWNNPTKTIEFEAKVEHISDELAEEQVWGSKTDMPSGPDVDMIIAETEAQVRDMRARTEAKHKMEHDEVHLPAEERVEIVEPTEERESTEGPGNEAFYRSDPQLMQEITEMLEESDELEAQSINVFVQAGNVILRGHVKSDEQRNAANHVASKALGVGEIRNELIVEK